jgi:hypothetical protein
MWSLFAAVASAAAPCDVSRADGVLQALRQVDAEQRPLLAAAYVAESCKVPAGLAKALTDLAGVPPEMRALIVMKAAADDPALILSACKGGPRVLAENVALAPADKRAHLWDGCGLERHAAVDRATFVAASGGDGLLYALTAQAVSGSASEPVVREALRAIAGAPAVR